MTVQGAVVRDQLALRAKNSDFRIKDLGAARIDAGSGCTSTSIQAAKCGTGVTVVNVDLRGGDDTLDDALADNSGIGAARPHDYTLNIDGGTGNDTIGPIAAPGAWDGGEDNDTLQGGAGIDTVQYTERAAAVTVTVDAIADDGNADDGPAGARDLIDAATVEAVEGGSAADTLIGDGNANTLRGFAGLDTLTGGGGADQLVAGPDGAKMDGGPGPDQMVGTAEGTADRVTYETRTAPVVVDLLDGSLSNEGEAGENDTLSVIDDVSGGSGNDRLVIPAGGNAGTSSPDNSVFGNGGDDVLGSAAGQEGGPGNDVLTGDASSPKILSGSAGDDEFRLAGGQVDIAVGGGGQDTVTYADSAQPVTVDLLSGLGGAPGEADVIVGDIENVTGSPGADTLRGDELQNVLDGGPGDDALFGRDAVDRVIGGTGKDTLDGGVGADVLDGGDEPNDIVDYSERTAPVTVDLGADTGGEAGESDVLTRIENVWGGAGNDTIGGGPEKNVLYGNPGDDTVRGLDGEDTVTGGAGRDALEGGTGSDVMEALDSTPDTVNCGEGTDTLTVDPIDALDPSCDETPFVVTPVTPAPEGTPAPPGNGALGGGIDPGPTAAPGDDRFKGVRIGTDHPGAPLVTAFAISPSRFAATKKPTAPAGAKRKPAKGTTFRFATDEAAVARIRIERLDPGRRSKARCVKPTRKNARAKRCVRAALVGTITRTVPKGAVKIAFTGRLGRTALVAASYRATVTLTDASGLVSKPKTTPFTVLKG